MTRRARKSRPSRVPVWSMHGEPGIDPVHARRYAWVTGLVVIALALALIVMISGPHRVGDYFAETDFYGAYADGAKALQHGVLDPTRYGVVGPGYEVVVG